MPRPRLEWCAWLALLLLVACAAPAPAPPPQGRTPVEPPRAAARSDVLARNDDFVVVMPAPGDDYAALAQRFLGDARRAWWIGAFNDGGRPRAGVEVVIPLKASVLNSVDRSGMHTLVVLCYHRFGATHSKLTVSADAFAAQMDWLASQDYTVVSLRDVQAILRGDQPMPPRAVAITIDDGYASALEIAYPILQRHGFPATVFLYTDFAGLPDAMSWAQMKDLAASGLIEIQPHSKSHANLSLRVAGETEHAYEDRLRQEIDTSVDLIQRRLGSRSFAFAFPYGDASETAIDVVRKRDIGLAFTVSPGGNPVFAYPMLLRRTMIFGDDTLAEFRAKLAVYARTGEP